MVEQLPTFHSCKTSLYHQRSKHLPQLPVLRNELVIQDECSETTAGEQLLICDDGHDDKIFIFGTVDNLRHLAAAPTVYADGTFYTCPRVFTQLTYTIHAKCEAIYTRFLQLLKTTANQNQIQLQPTTFFVDFEVAIKNASEAVFPGVSVKGRFFRYTQCIWRKAQQCGLQVSFSENDEVQKLVRRAAVLPLIPSASVEDLTLTLIQHHSVTMLLSTGQRTNATYGTTLKMEDLVQPTTCKAGIIS
ncbi:hypothetical protein KUTeg_007615 [Tegillarca granosa]|uniref:MULE transposase domain-containing protein n=1 Tax=Tegillarca granosa TaxID=220873 RepID=A0ABQ9FIE5_TEGGR|nr:hypothetical protein KUTeg_007615 [Tegillarca granosa]